mmetsp:Transcript_23044/g.54541  ORF Transcript_23044/g.54541 Transcript_23044/m.54541 type:complete len:82 (+) Transcript_23044:104-349(+)
MLVLGFRLAPEASGGSSLETGARCRTQRTAFWKLLMSTGAPMARTPVVTNAIGDVVNLPPCLSTTATPAGNAGVPEEILNA